MAGRKVKREREFFFNDLSKEEFVEIINQRFPIKFDDDTELVNRIRERYPLLTKKKIRVILISIFETMREFLLLGKVLNFNRFMYDMKVLVSPSFLKKFNKLIAVIKVKLKTPTKIKNKEYDPDE